MSSNNLKRPYPWQKTGDSCKILTKVDRGVVMKPLFELAVEFIIKHIENLQSVQGLPESMGEIMFNRFSGSKYLSVAQVMNGLQVFSDAYTQVLCSVNLRRSQIFVEGFTGYLSILLTNVVELDLGHCKLGPGHEILSTISRMTRLRCLGLRDNEISDDCWRKTTLRSRMFGDGMKQITTLDLSDNAKLSKCLAYCVHFRQLHFLDVSNTNINVETATEFCKKMDLVCKTDPMSRTWSRIETCGWAKDFLEDLKVNCQSPKTKSESKGFYKKLRLTEIRNTDPGSENLPDENCVVCVRSPR